MRLERALTNPGSDTGNPTMTTRSLARTLTHSRLRQEKVGEEDELPICVLRHRFPFEEPQNMLPLFTFLTHAEGSTVSDSGSDIQSAHKPLSGTSQEFQNKNAQQKKRVL